MNRIVRLSVILLIAAACLFQSAHVFALSAESSYSKAKKAYFELLDSPKKQKYRDQWLKVRDLFLKVERVDPEHQRSADALYMAGKVSQGLYDISYVKNDLRDAVTYFDRLALAHPGSSLADDGLLTSAELFEQKLGDKQKAIEHYRRVLSIYPDGDMAPAALRRLEAIAPDSIPAPPTKAVSEVPGSGMITDVRYHSYPDFTRIVLDLDSSAQAKPGFVKGDSPRIFLDISPAKIVANQQPVQIDDGRVERVRMGQNSLDIARVVLDLNAAHPYQVFTLNDPFRIIIDVSGPMEQQVAADLPAPDSEPQKTVAKPTPVPEKPMAASKPPAAPDEDELAEVISSGPKEDKTTVKVPKSTQSHSKLRIVIDPGHGGRDPGAIGPRGVMEKDVTLALAKSLASRLKKSYACEVILTRDKDVYIPLDERTLIANRLNADLFISLHANANNSRKPYGVETYYLNFSKNDDVIEVVARENNTSLKEVGDLDMILLDLMANSKINESSRLAAEIQEALVDNLSRKYSHIKDLGVRQGPFHVLWNATMPSVLVEVAFISNRREEKRLVDRNFQNRSAAAIAKGVGNYLEAFNLASN